MLHLFSVGRDSLDFIDFESIEYNIKDKKPIYGFYSYSSGPYEGDGYFIVFCKNGFIFENLSHCSCYGPLESEYCKFELQSYEELTEENFKNLFDYKYEHGIFIEILFNEIKGIYP